MSNPVTRTRFGLTRRTVLTNAQVKALPTVPVEVVPAQGVNCWIVPMCAAYQSDFTGLAYGNIADPVYSNLGLCWNGNINRPAVEVRQATGWLNAAAISRISVGTLGTLDNLLDFLNQPVICNVVDSDGTGVFVYADNQGGGNFNGGDPGNSLIVTVFYNVVNLG